MTTPPVIDSTTARLDAAAALANAKKALGRTVPDLAVGTARAAGAADGEITEVCGHVTANGFFDYFRRTARDDIGLLTATPRGSAS